MPTNLFLLQMLSMIIDMEFNDGLTILIPVYQDSEYLSETIQSVKNFTSQEVEIVVVEDGPSFKVNQKIATEEKVKYIFHSANVGISGNFNRCIDITTSSFYLIIGPDDRLVPNPTKHLEEELHTLENGRNNKVIYYLPTRVINEHGYVKKSLRELFKYILKSLDDVTFHKLQFETILLGYWLYSPSIIWPNNMIKSYYYSPEYAMAADFHRVARYLMNGYQFRELKTSAYLEYRRHPNSESASPMNRTRVREEEILIFGEARKYMISQKKLIGLGLTYIQFSSRLASLITIANDKRIK